jgi:hypothetical protein
MNSKKEQDEREKNYIGTLPTPGNADIASFFQ